MKRKVDRFTKLSTELFQILDEKEDRIRTLEAVLKTHQAASESEWTLPKVFKRNQNQLPVPRLEVRCHNQGDWSHSTWVYGLFYRHLDGRYLLLPMWRSKIISGGGMPVRNGKPQPPRDAEKLIKHDIEHFGLPGFVIVGDLVEEFSAKTSRRHSGLARKTNNPEMKR
jgi:hypothetical protein